jgi:SAM-dependent methyltransferase
MPAEYDKIARQFKKSRELPFRKHVEIYTFLKMLGDVSGMSVLDLACGEGEYSRLVRARGASKVVGVDLSESMIELARAQELRAPIGITYISSGVEQLGIVGEFDVVTAAYLLHYAPTREQLSAMARTIASNLRPGGRLVALISNIGPGVPVDISQYGWGPSELTPIEEGTPYRLTFLSGSDSFEIENFYYPHAIYEDILRNGGFQSVSWHSPGVSDEGVREWGSEYWRTILEHPPIIGLVCRR